MSSSTDMGSALASSSLLTERRGLEAKDTNETHVVANASNRLKAKIGCWPLQMNSDNTAALHDPTLTVKTKPGACSYFLGPLGIAVRQRRTPMPPILQPYGHTGFVLG
jgi:hypothetical protein